MKSRISLALILLGLVIVGSCQSDGCPSFFCGITDSCPSPTPTTPTGTTCAVTQKLGSGDCTCTATFIRDTSGKGDNLYCVTCTRINGKKETFVTTETAGSASRAVTLAQTECSGN